MGTLSRTLASYVIYQNHLPMAAGYPSAYRGHPGLPMLAKHFLIGVHGFSLQGRKVA